MITETKKYLIMLDNEPFQCTFPWTGMVINPQGNITVCCAYHDDVSLGHIDNIEDLHYFFLEDAYMDLRSKFKNGWRNNPACVKCIVNPRQGPISHSRDFSINGGGLQYLEFTTSNVCNQTCAMCSSKFSSKWIKIESIFEIENMSNYTKPWSMSDDNIDVVIKALPGLKEIFIKGGEPFADMKNLRIINALADINPDCRLRICSNMQMIPKVFISSIKKLNDVRISASVDAIGKRFNWIRGGDFDKVVKNIEWVWQETGIKSQITPCVSVYNFNYLREIYDFFKYKEYCDLSEIYSVVVWPEYHNPGNIFSQKQINSSISNQFDDIRFNKDCDVKALYFIKSSGNNKWLSDYKKFTKTMNTIRGFEIEI